MNSMRQWLVLAVTAILVGPGNVMAEPVTFAKDAPLRSEPRFDAATAAQIKKGATGDATAKQGPWLNIKTPQATGWALTTDVLIGAGAGSSAGSTSVAGLFGGSPRPGGTATLGTRGFDKETIGNALGDRGSASQEQLAMLDGYAVNKDDGQAFASTKGLSATSVSY